MLRVADPNRGFLVTMDQKEFLSNYFKDDYEEGVIYDGSGSNYREANYYSGAVVILEDNSVKNAYEYAYHLKDELEEDVIIHFVGLRYYGRDEDGNYKMVDSTDAKVFKKINKGKQFYLKDSDGNIVTGEYFFGNYDNPRLSFPKSLKFQDDLQAPLLFNEDLSFKLGDETLYFCAYDDKIFPSLNSSRKTRLVPLSLVERNTYVIITYKCIITKDQSELTNEDYESFNDNSELYNAFIENIEYKFPDKYSFYGGIVPSYNNYQYYKSATRITDVDVEIDEIKCEEFNAYAGFKIKAREDEIPSMDLEFIINDDITIIAVVDNITVEYI